MRECAALGGMIGTGTVVWPGAVRDGLSILTASFLLFVHSGLVLWSQTTGTSDVRVSCDGLRGDSVTLFVVVDVVGEECDSHEEGGTRIGHTIFQREVVSMAGACLQKRGVIQHVHVEAHASFRYDMIRNEDTALSCHTFHRRAQCAPR